MRSVLARSIITPDVLMKLRGKSRFASVEKHQLFLKNSYDRGFQFKRVNVHLTVPVENEKINATKNWTIHEPFAQI